MSVISDQHHSPATILQAYLREKSFGVDPTSSNTWKIFVGSMPDDDDPDRDQAICIYDTAGILFGKCMCNGRLYQQYGIAIRIRSISYDEGYRRANNILDNLTAMSRETVMIGAFEYVLISFSPTTGIIPLGEVENRSRKSFSLNGIVAVNNAKEE